MENVIFVSCGQLTESELALGSAIKQTIDDTAGFAAYFAQEVQNLEGLGNNVLDALRTCSGAVIVLTDRGPAIGLDGVERGRRSSV